jgi:autotransporter translocation and assembly factor TamB
MKLYQIVAKDIMRRKRRVLYAALGVVIGTMTVVGILTIASAGEAKIYKQLEQYGPNLTVIPAINNLDMKLGDLSMGTLTVGENYIPEDQLPRIRHRHDRTEAFCEHESKWNITGGSRGGSTAGKNS